MSTNTILTILNTTPDAQLAESLAQSGLLGTKLSSSDIEAIANRFCKLSSLQAIDLWEKFGFYANNDRYATNIRALWRIVGKKLIFIYSECPEYAAYKEVQEELRWKNGIFFDTSFGTFASIHEQPKQTKTNLKE